MERLARVASRRSGSGSKRDSSKAQKADQRANANAHLNPWVEGSAAAEALQNYASFLKDPDQRQLLEELHAKVETLFGTEAIDPAKGVWNLARLFRFLRSAEMDVNDAVNLLIASDSLRVKHSMNAKRELIVSEDFSLSSLPRVKEAHKCKRVQPRLSTLLTFHESTYSTDIRIVLALQTNPTTCFWEEARMVKSSRMENWATSRGSRDPFLCTNMSSSTCTRKNASG